MENGILHHHYGLTVRDTGPMALNVFVFFPQQEKF